MWQIVNEIAVEIVLVSLVVMALCLIKHRPESKPLNLTCASCGKKFAAAILLEQAEVLKCPRCVSVIKLIKHS